MVRFPLYIRGNKTMQKSYLIAEIKNLLEKVEHEVTHIDGPPTQAYAEAMVDDLETIFKLYFNFDGSLQKIKKLEAQVDELTDIAVDAQKEAEQYKAELNTMHDTYEKELKVRSDRIEELQVGAKELSEQRKVQDALLRQVTMLASALEELVTKI